MVTLKKHVGVFPTEPREQNSKWFKLYKMVEHQVEASSAQKDFLMYRDMAVLSLPLIVLVPLVLYFVHAGSDAMLAAAILFAVQYVLCAVSARHAGVRFVCNVLAIHAAKKVAAL